MAPNREMIEAFVDGRLTASEHELMVHHISSCTECAAAVIAALAEAARALNAEASERLNSATAGVDAEEIQTAIMADLNQLDLILDSSSSDASSLLLKPEHVHEVQLDELTSHRASPRQPTAFVPAAQPGAVTAELVGDVQLVDDTPPEAPESIEEVAPVAQIAATEGLTREEEAEPANEEISAVEEVVPVDPDVEEIATATAADVAESVAHGAAALAASVDDTELRAEPVEVFEGEIPEVELAELVTDGDWSDIVEDVSVEPAELSSVASVLEEPPEDRAEVLRDERIPDDERAAIAAAVRAGAIEDASPRRRVSTVLGLAAVFLVFVGVAAFAAVQLRDFAAGGPSPVAVGTDLASAEQDPPSVLEELLIAERVAFITDVAEDSAVLFGAESLVAPDTSEPPTPAVTESLPVQRAPAGAAARTRVPSTPRAQGISPEPAAGSRLLRTTTHRVGPDVDFVLREYETDAPAPPPREGVNEYRWTDAAAGRLFVLSGPATVAELRSYARRLQNGGG